MVVALAPVEAAHADELTQIVQQSLINLGYDPGPANGEATTKTIIAVAKFQTLNNLEPTGEITPQLAGIIQASTSKQSGPAKAHRPAAVKPDTKAIPGPGVTVRNVFGPDVGLGANQCRGACLDNCLQNNPISQECQPQCDATAMAVYGFESSTSWLLGNGPYDGKTIFEYTRFKPTELEAAYHCPESTTRQCGDSTACIAASGDSPEDIQISMTMLDENGNPDESKRVGSEPVNGPASIPRSITLPAASGHLFVPMYQLSASSKPCAEKERRVTCKHKGEPVLVTTFVLQ